ncbi:MAG: hypothetical protein ABL898_16865 [Hyphomicrobiaceae bacterium]
MAEALPFLFLNLPVVVTWLEQGVDSSRLEGWRRPFGLVGSPKFCGFRWELLMVSKAEVRAALKHAINNEDEVKASEQAGCFHCLEIFDVSEIEDWVETEGGHSQSAVCPHCDVESVIGDGAGFALTEEFLTALRDVKFA